jgi:hypothetical protein
VLVLIDLNPRSDGAFRALALYEFKPAQNLFQIGYSGYLIRYVLVIKRTVSVRNKYRRQAAPLPTSQYVYSSIALPSGSASSGYGRPSSADDFLSVSIPSEDMTKICVSNVTNSPYLTAKVFSLSLHEEHSLPCYKENDKILPHFIVPQLYLSPLT